MPFLFATAIRQIWSLLLTLFAVSLLRFLRCQNLFDNHIAFHSKRIQTQRTCQCSQFHIAKSLKIRLLIRTTLEELLFSASLWRGFLRQPALLAETH